MAEEKVEKVTGRVAEAAGAVSGDRALKNRGRAKQAKATVKEAAEKAQEALSGARGARSAEPRR